MSSRTITFRPIQLERESELSVRMNNLLLNKARVFSFSLSETKNFRVRLLPGRLKQLTVSPISFTLGLGDSIAGLWLTHWPLLDNIREFIPEAMLERLPENLGIALLENALESLLVIAEHGLSTKIKIQALSAERNSKIYTLPLAFELSELTLKDGQVTNSTQIMGTLLVEERIYPLLQERLRHWPSDLNEEWGELAIPLNLELSRMQLSVTELHNLAVSDVLLLNDIGFYHQKTIRLSLNTNLYCHTTFNPTTKKLTVNTEWITMSDQDQKNNIENLNQVPVQLSFDIGSHSMSFNELKQVRPGYIIELTNTLPEIVQIRSQNKLLGTGELVDINGRIGIKITSIFGTKKVS